MNRWQWWVALTLGYIPFGIALAVMFHPELWQVLVLAALVGFYGGVRSWADERWLR